MSDTEKAPAASGVEEEGVTMLDVLEEEEALEDDCAAVLGNVSDTQCSYSQGYLSRQPLYAAREATVPGQRAGVCLACSYHCLGVSQSHSFGFGLFDFILPIFDKTSMVT